MPLLHETDPSQLVGPLQQFQSKKLTDEGAFEIVLAINKLISRPRPTGDLRKLFNLVWPQALKQIEDIPAPPVTPKRQSTEAVLEQLVLSVQENSAELRKLVQIRERLTFPTSRIAAMSSPVATGNLQRLLAEGKVGFPLRASKAPKPKPSDDEG